MKKATLMVLIMGMLGTIGLSACHTTHPHGCPPGQAKKGNCLHHHMHH